MLPIAVIYIQQRQSGQRKTTSRKANTRMSMIEKDLPKSESLWDDLDILMQAKAGDTVVVVGRWEPLKIEKATKKFVTVSGRKFRRQNGDMVSKRYANSVPRILPLTTRTMTFVEGIGN